jgi:DNA polymerase delta subunit OB-fold domain
LIANTSAKASLMPSPSKSIIALEPSWLALGAAVAKILNLPEGQEVAVVGTLYKEMKLKPSILDAYVKERGLAGHVGAARLTQADDTLVLEDESARMVLRGADLHVGELITGAQLLPQYSERCQPQLGFD